MLGKLQAFPDIAQRACDARDPITIAQALTTPITVFLYVQQLAMTAILMK